MLADVARVARLRAVDAESLVEEELAAERDFLRSHRVVGRNGHRFVSRELLGEWLRGWSGSAGLRSFDVATASGDKNDGYKYHAAGVHRARILPVLLRNV